MLVTGDVIWVFDRTTRPAKNKMIVCLSFANGWFLRINTSGRFRPAVFIDNARNPWLDHNSYVECTLLEFDEFEIEESSYEFYKTKFGEFEQYRIENCYACEKVEFKPIITLKKLK